MPSLGVRTSGTSSFTNAGVVLGVKGLGGFTSGLASASKATQLFGRNLSSTTRLTKTQKNLMQLQNGLFKVAGAIIKTAAIAGIAGVAIGVGISVAALKTAADVQQLTYALQGLVAIEIGRKQEAQGLILDMSTAMEDAIPIADNLVIALRDVALQSPIQYEQVFQALRLQLAYGATALATETFTAKIKEFGLSMDKAKHPALSMAEAVSQVGAVLARDAATFERLNYNLAQAIQKGILTAKNMRELKNAGLDLEQVFREELNMTLEETDAAFKAGTISSEDMSVAFISFAEKYFAPAAQRMTRSLRGVTNNLKDLWAFAAADTMTPVLEIITGKLGELFDEGEKLLQAGHFKRLGEDIAVAATKVVDLVSAINAYNIGAVETTVKTIAFAAGMIVAASAAVKLINILGQLQGAIIKFQVLQQFRGTAAAITALVNPYVLIAVAIGAALVAIYAIVTALEAHKRAQREINEALIESTTTYPQYLAELEAEELVHKAIEQSLYNELKARQAVDSSISFDGLLEEKKALEDLILEWDHFFKIGEDVGHWYNKLFGFSDDYRTMLQEKVIPALSEEQRVMGKNVEAMTQVYLTRGKSAQAAYDHAVALKEEIEKVEALEKAEKAYVKFLGIAINATEEARRTLAAKTRTTALAAEENENLTATEQDQKDTLKELEAALEDINEAYEMWNETLVDTVLELKDIEDEAIDAHQDWADAISDINNDLGKDLKDIGEKYDDAMPDPTEEDARAGSVIDVWDEWARRMRAIGEEGGPEEDLEAEGGWLATIQGWTEGTDFAMRENEENVMGWMQRLEKLFLEGKLPDEFYEEAKQTRGWQEFYAELKVERDKDTQSKRDKAAADKAIEDQALLDAQAAAEDKRQDALLLGALTLSESSGQLGRWADSLPGIMGAGLQTAQQVFDALKAGTLTLPPALAAIITPLMAGLSVVSESAKGTAAENETVLDGLAAKAKEAETQIPGLTTEYNNLKATLDAIDAEVTPGLGEGFSEEEVAAMRTRLIELDTTLKSFGLNFGAEFPGQASEMQITVDSLFLAIQTGITDLDAANTELAIGLAKTAGGVADAWYDAYFGESVVPDTKQAVTDVGTAWDGLQTHMKASLIVTTAAIKATWMKHVKDIKGYLTDLVNALNPVKLLLEEIKAMDPIEVTIKITVESSPGVGLAEGADKVDNLVASLMAIPADVGVVISIDLPKANEIGKSFGDLLVAASSAMSPGGKGTAGRWWDFTQNLFDPGNRLGGLADNFAKRWEDIELPQFQERIAEIDKLLKEQNITEEDRNRLMEERLRLQDDMVANEQTMLDLEKGRADIDFLRQQVDLLEIIRNHKLNAQQILGDITLGIDASAAELMTVTTRALEAVVEQINRQLMIASPSAVMMEIGKFMMLGMGKGITEAAHIPVQATTSAVIAPVMAAGGAMGNTMNVTMNPTINTGMDQVVFENRVLDVVRRGSRGW